MHMDVQQKSNELNAAKAKIQDLEQTLAKKDAVIVEQKELIRKIKVNYQTSKPKVPS